MTITSQDFQFKRMFDALPGRFIVLRRDMTVAAVTDEYLKATYRNRAEVIDCNLFDIFPDNPQDANHSAEVRRSIEKVFRTGAPDELPAQKYDVQRAGSAEGEFKVHYWSLKTFPYFNDQEKVELVIHRIEDITDGVELQRKGIEQEKIFSEMKIRSELIKSERDQAATALEDTRLRLAYALEVGSIGTWVWDVVNNRVVADKSLANFFSVSETDAAGGAIENYFKAIHPEDRERTVAVINESLEDKDSYEAEYRLVMPDQSVRWVVARGKIVRDAQNRPMQLPGVVIDITERKKSEQALSESEERFQLVAGATNDAIWDWNFERDYVWWNEGVSSIFGYAPDKVKNTSDWWYQHIHPEDRDRVVGKIHEIIDGGGENWSDEYRFLCADGGFKYVFDRGFIMHRDGKPIRMLGAMQDITERKKVEEAYRQSQERLKLILDSSQLGLWYCDLPFDVLSWSGLTKEHFWLPPETVVTYDLFYERIHADDREVTRAEIDNSIADQTQYDVEYRTVNPASGDVKWIRAIGRGFYTEAGVPYRFDGITIDITDDKQIQTEREHLLWSEKEARRDAEQANRVKDEFLATLSHELRTPMTSILGWARILAKGSLDEFHTKRAVETIERNARSQSQLIEDILDVSRITSGKLRLNIVPVNILDIIESAIDSVRPAAEAKAISIVRQFPAQIGLISGDADRLQQIIWNLLSNAIKFTPHGGTVGIELHQGAASLEIVVSDDGIGIEAETLPFVFERFRQSDSSTTRRHGGLGLGLAIVRHLAELHGGSVRAASAGENRGAEFIVSFPLIGARSEDGDEQTENVRDEEPPFQSPEKSDVSLKDVRILIVEDEKDTCDLLSSILRRSRAAVTCAASAEEALQAFEKDEFDVLISDIGMPGQDGYELIKNVRSLPLKKGGQIPAVALTAYARAEDREKSLAAGFQAHLAKPFDPDELTRTVAEIAGEK